MGNMICPACSTRTNTVTFHCEHCGKQLYPIWHAVVIGLAVMGACSAAICGLLWFALR
jgi:hypothetical protein